MSHPIQLEAKDFEEAMDFLNLVFGETAPHDFERMLPVCYRPSEMGCNYTIREGGRIQAIVGLFERDWQLGGHTLRVGGIGGVSTHARARGRGHMRTLMQHCLGRMEREALDLSWLQGRRQRYAWFGYEVCGLAVSMRFDPDSVSSFEDLPLRLERIEAHRAGWLDAVQALHEQQPMRHTRARENLHGYLVAWKSEPWVALDGSGNVVGYLVADKEGSILELAAREDLLAGLVRAWLLHTGRRANLRLSPLDTHALRVLGNSCAACRVGSTGNWRVLRWDRVLAALLPMRAATGPVLPGVVVLGIEGVGALRVECDGQQFVSEMRPATEASLVLDEATAMRLLFGPLRPSQTMELPSGLALLDQWCPLPLYWATQDGV